MHNTLIIWVVFGLLAHQRNQSCLKKITIFQLQMRVVRGMRMQLCLMLFFELLLLGAGAVGVCFNFGLLQLFSC